MKLKGVYTVEAAVVMSFCFLAFGLGVMLAYSTFSDSVSYIQTRESDFDAVRTFRNKEELKEIYGNIIQKAAQ